MKLPSLLILILTSFVLNSFGQDVLTPSTVGTGTLMGISKPLKDIPIMTAEEMAEMKLKAESKMLNPKLRTREYPYAATALPKGPDPAWQKENGSNRAASADPTVNFVAQSSPYFPPDCNGTAGPNHYMQTVNTTYAIYDKTGTKLAGPTNMNQLFGSVPGANCNDGDPIMLYDEMADRWFAAEFSLCGSPDRMLIAVSTTNDPTGTWYQYSFNMSGMPDYEKFGIWSDGIYMGTNTSSGTDIYVFEREAMLAGQPSPKMVSFDNQWRPGSVDGFMMVPPLDCDGTTPPPAGEPGLFIAQQDDAFGGSGDQLWIYELDVDWATTTNSSFTRAQMLDVEPYDSNFGNNWNNIKQPSTSQELDAIPQVVMNVPQYRNWGSYETIVLCHTVDVDQTDHAGVRWYELRRVAGGDWTVRQTGTYAPDQHSRWMGSIMMNGSKELALGYSVSSTSEFPGIRYTGQTEAEYNAASGIMDVAEGIIHTGTASQTGANRWGDYSQMSVDPEDDETFWYTNQYVSGGSKTKVAAFNIGPLGPSVNYQVDNNKPCVNTPVQFTDLTTGSPISWSWQFTPNTVTYLNGTSSTSQNPQVQFNEYGNYDVELTATSAVGANTLLSPAYISVNEANPGFTPNYTNIVVNNPVIITDISTCDVKSYLWNFGEGASPETATTAGPHEVIYSTTGTKTVTLTVNGTITETKTDYITVIEDFFTMGNQTITTCTGTFADPGGNYNYGNNQLFTTTFMPSQPGGQVTVDFTEFNLEASTNCSSDYLKVYNGKSSLSPSLGTFCGTDLPGTFTADNQFGALTFVFKSNQSVNNSGWLATVSCAAGVINPVDMNALTYSDTRIDLHWELNPDGNNVMLVYSTDGTFGTPMNGTSYSVGQTLTGGGTVIYNENGTLFSHTMLTPATTYYYKAYSYNAENQYSSGTTASASTMNESPYISIDPLAINAPATAGTSTFNVLSNINWTAVSDMPWCNVTPSGIGAGMLNANYTENYFAEPRTANITVTVLGLDPITVTLTQTAAPAYIELDPQSFDVVSAAGSVDVQVLSNAAWNVSTESDWVTVTPSGNGNGIISIQYSENLRAEVRSATIAIDVEGLGQNFIVLNQEAAEGYLTIQPALSEVTAQAGTIDLQVSANLNWVATVDASWVTVPSNGTGEQTLTANYTENTETQSRSAIIYLNANGMQQQTASIIQAGAEAFLTVANQTLELTAPAGTQNVIVMSNTSWTATSSEDWLTVTPSGTGNGSLNLNYTENTLTTDRTAVVSMKIGTDVKATINVTQLSSVGLAENQTNGLQIYPNPAKDHFVIEVNKNLYPQITVTVTDQAGLTVLTSSFKGSERYTMNSSKLAAGTYTVNIISGEKSITQKLVIVR